MVMELMRNCLVGAIALGLVFGAWAGRCDTARADEPVPVLSPDEATIIPATEPLPTELGGGLSIPDGGPGGFAPPAGGQGVLPEPGVLSLLAVGGLALLRRRRLA